MNPNKKIKEITSRPQMLTQELLKQKLLYNKQTGNFHWTVSTGGKLAGEIAGSINRDGYVLIRVYRKLYLAHRLAWLYMTGKEPKNLVDHIDRNPGNNKWDNLREATYSQNEMNRGPAYCNRTGIKGVMPTKHGTYRAFVVKDRVQHTRSFKTLNEAEQWVKMKRKTLHLDRATDI